ncbi:MAG: hypothetical protein ABS79_03050, partial [Planctomycetes bacterium SCN 63-9]
MGSRPVLGRPVSYRNRRRSGAPRMVGPNSQRRVPRCRLRSTARASGSPFVLGRFPGTARGLAALIGISAGLMATTGCVERRYTLRTDPPGALAIVNDEEIGPTPVSRNFTFYGDRKITFIRDGYETKTVIQPMKAPWYDNLFTEFFTENLIPYTFRDEREFTYKLDQYQEPTVESLQGRAEELRAIGKTQPPP